MTTEKSTFLLNNLKSFLEEEIRDAEETLKAFNPDVFDSPALQHENIKGFIRGLRLVKTRLEVWEKEVI